MRDHLGVSSPGLATMRTTNGTSATIPTKNSDPRQQGRGSQHAERRFSRTAAWLFVVVLILSGGSSPIDVASCEPAVQRGQPQAKQQSNELTGLQDSSQFLRRDADGDGAPLGEILAALGDKRGSFTNAKRARKMSAFMPMRGRKDGRDLIGSDSLRDFRSGLSHFAPSDSFERVAPRQQQQQQQQQQQSIELEANRQQLSAFNQQIQAVPLRELDPNEASLVRLFQGRATIPRQFFNQLQARAARAAKPVLAPVSLEQVAAETEMVGRGDPQAELSMNGNHIMQAKLRRAFHPMRGKRGTLGLSLEDLLASPDQAESDSELF